MKKEISKLRNGVVTYPLWNKSLQLCIIWLSNHSILCVWDEGVPDIRHPCALNLKSTFSLSSDFINSTNINKTNTHLSSNARNTKKDMTLDVQVLACDKHKHVVKLNRLLWYHPCLGNTIASRWKHKIWVQRVDDCIPVEYYHIF